MDTLAIGGWAFLAVAGAACLGLIVRSRLPDHHLSAESKDAIKLATAIIGTLSALALSLLIASAKKSFDDANAELRTWAGRVVLLDRVMAHYGPETAKLRLRLKALVSDRLDEANGGASKGEILDDGPNIEAIQVDLRSLTSSTDAQKWLKSRALQLSGQIAETKWLRPEAESQGFPSLLILCLVFWLALLFGSFGMLSPMNITVVVTLLVSALSVAGALVLIIDMDHPHLGFVRVSDAPLRLAIERLGQR